MKLENDEKLEITNRSCLSPIYFNITSRWKRIFRSKKRENALIYPEISESPLNSSFHRPIQTLLQTHALSCEDSNLYKFNYRTNASNAPTFSKKIISSSISNDDIYNVFRPRQSDIGPSRVALV